MNRARGSHFCATTQSQTPGPAIIINISTSRSQQNPGRMLAPPFSRNHLAPGANVSPELVGPRSTFWSEGWTPLGLLVGLRGGGGVPSRPDSRRRIGCEELCIGSSGCLHGAEQLLEILRKRIHRRTRQYTFLPFMLYVRFAICLVISVAAFWRAFPPIKLSNFQASSMKSVKSNTPFSRRARPAASILRSQDSSFKTHQIQLHP